MWSVTVEVTAEGEERFVNFADRSPASHADAAAREYRCLVEVRGPSGVLYTADGRPLAETLRQARYPGQMDLISTPMSRPRGAAEKEPSDG